MLLKLAKNGMKGKITDYLTLFSGLTISVAVMYMFLTLAVNKDFITQNSVINSIQFVFLIGAILLSIITFFYVVFAHSFLLSLRKKEFGTYMLLGVKRKQLKKIARIEIFIIGVLSTAIGISLGILLSSLLLLLMTKQLQIELTGFHAFYLPASLLTIFYYTIALLLSSFWQHRKIMKTPVLDFIYADLQPNPTPKKKKATVLKMLLAFISLIIGYIALIFMEQLREIGLITATISTTIGTYLLFSSFLPTLVEKMKTSRRWYLKDLQTFTFSQLHFRMDELKRILATVAMLIALSAGAISGGFAFLNNASLIAEESTIYDLRLFHPTEEEKTILKAIPFTLEETYHVKFDEDHFYYSIEELALHPPLVQDDVTNKIRPAEGLTPQSTIEINKWGNQEYSDEWYNALYQITPSVPKWTMLLPKDDYEKLPFPEYSIQMGKTDDFLAHKDAWKKLDELQRTQYEVFGEAVVYYDSKYYRYEEYYAFASGTFFMGFFLGIAFLMMMASMLMFKVLANAPKDVRRYEMLRKMGVKSKDLSRSLRKELGLIFLFPAVLGLLHVLIGMNLFSFILLEPYEKLWVSIVIFVSIYLLYYGLTFMMYKKIVLPKTKTRH